MKKKGRFSKKNRTLSIKNYREAEVPRSFVIHHGMVGASVKHLISDFKKLMKPNTAEKLIARKGNSLKDFISMAGPLKVTHLMIFSHTETGLYLKISRLPQGPTLSFSIENYCLMKDVISSKTQQMIHNKHSLYAPCLMTNLQPSEGEQHLQLCSKMFLDMFPTISPSHVRTNEIKRCCFIHYDQDTSLFDFRHYAVKVQPVGISKATRKIIGSKVPNLSSYKEVSDYVVKSEALSESEAEGDSSNRITIDKKRKGKLTKQQSIVKLSEIGPRLTIKLVKIEDRVCDGTVLYHSYYTKTAEEKLDMQKKRQQQWKLKRMRQTEQERNIQLKEEKKEAHRQRCLQGMGIDASSKRKKPEEDDDDDAEYYKEEIGEEPDKDLFKKTDRQERPNYRKFAKKKFK